MTKVADLLKRDANTFDVLRMLAATLVIFSHSFALVGLPEPTLQGVSLGALGVRIFFILSGVLIAASWVSHPRTAAFIGKRLLRILPGLAVVTFAMVFVLGPLITVLPLRQYFSDNLTYQYLNGISVFGMQAMLPGVFTNPHSAIANGPLWTLPYELFAYLMVALLGRTKLLKKRRVVLGLFAACVAARMLARHYLPDLILFTLNVSILLIFFGFFLAGVLCFLYRERLVLAWQGAVVALLVLIISIPLRNSIFEFLSFFTLPYLVLYAGSLTRWGLQKLGQYGDFSYGLYIYGWPVQQLIVQLSHNNIGHYRLFVYSFTATLVLAVLSWRYIEKPMLQLKTSFSTEKYPVAEDAW